MKHPTAVLVCVANFIAACTVADAALPGAPDVEAVAIESRASADYMRIRDADGKPVAETFAFAKGGVWRSGEAGSKDPLDFMAVARTVAAPLASQNYISSKDPGRTKLLVVVYWGTTRVPDKSTSSVAGESLQAASEAAMSANHPQPVRFNAGDSCAPNQMAQTNSINYTVMTPDQIDTDNAMSAAMSMSASVEHQRNLVDEQNAMMLGYDSWWAETAQFKDSPQDYRRADMLAELEDRRYFVVLMAYDFQKLWKEKKPKLLWETRFSIREDGDDFTKHLAAMAGSAAAYFGRDSGKLLHKPLPEGRVDVGEIKNLALEDSK
ncbi:MAG TPA: hypothetical protein VFE25_11410 [Opitutaceae bacterium]|jgi:hypothetical protein|nr:hypothetical protein [Opitutaceae bacterium]